jgi:hypothetical protein
LRAKDNLLHANRLVLDVLGLVFGNRGFGCSLNLRRDPLFC